MLALSQSLFIFWCLNMMIWLFDRPGLILSLKNTRSNCDGMSHDRSEDPMIHHIGTFQYVHSACAVNWVFFQSISEWNSYLLEEWKKKFQNQFNWIELNILNLSVCFWEQTIAVIYRLCKSQTPSQFFSIFPIRLR